MLCLFLLLIKSAVSFSQDAVYIDLGGSHAHEGEEGTIPNDFVSSLMQTRHPLDAKMKQSQVTLFKVKSLTLCTSVFDETNSP